MTQENPSNTVNNILKPLPPQFDTINMNIVYVERNKDDPLIGKELWQEIDQIATIVPEQRQKLRELGFSVGVTGSQPSRALQRILNLRSEITDLASTSREHHLVGHETNLPSGSKTEIQTSLQLPQIEFNNIPGNQINNKTLTDARCVLSIKAERLQDGWVKLIFLPEIHHGLQSIRPQPGQQNFELKQSQEIIPLYEYQFDVTISIGEMVILGREPACTDKLAEHFFSGENKEGITSRVIIVRLNDIQSIKPIYQETHYGKY
jgi:hypothetical protein